MRVAADDDVKAVGGWVEIERMQVVEDVDDCRANLGDCGLRKKRIPVDVASDGHNWGQLSQLFQNFGFAYVPGVEDEGGAGERLQSLGTQPAMSIRDQSDDHADGRQARFRLLRMAITDRLRLCSWSPTGKYSMVT